MEKEKREAVVQAFLRNYGKIPRDAESEAVCVGCADRRYRVLRGRFGGYLLTNAGAAVTPETLGYILAFLKTGRMAVLIVVVHTDCLMSKLELAASGTADFTPEQVEERTEQRGQSNKVTLHDNEEIRAAVAAGGLTIAFVHFDVAKGPQGLSLLETIG